MILGPEAVERCLQMHYRRQPRPFITADVAETIASWFASPLPADTPFRLAAEGRPFDAPALSQRAAQRAAEAADARAAEQLLALRDWADGLC